MKDEPQMELTAPPLEAGTPAAAAAAKKDRRWWVLFTILAVEVMDLLDGTIVNVAAPAIRESFGATLSAMQWVTGGYALAFAIGLVTGGRLGDIYGRRRMFLLGLAGFVLSSAACGFAWSPEALVGFRLVQGLFAASMIPQGFGIVRQVFPPDEVGKAFAMFGPVIGGSSILGPVIGGVLVDANLFGTGWRSIFLVNVPLGIVAFVAAWKLLPESKSAKAPSLDVMGAVLVSAVAGLLIFPLIQGPESGWPAWSFAMMAGSGVVLAAFVWLERKREAGGQAPLVAMRLFEARAFSAGLTMVLVFFAAMLGLMFSLSVFLQVGQQFSAVRTGLAIIPWAVGTGIGAGVSAQVLAPRYGRKVLHGAVLTLMAGVASMGALVWLEGPVTWWSLIGPELLCGLGMGAVISPLFNFVLAGVRDDEVGSASGVLNAVQQLGGAAGIAVVGTVFLAQVRLGQFAGGFVRALGVELALLAVCFGLVWLLPLKAREADGH